MRVYIFTSLDEKTYSLKEGDSFSIGRDEDCDIRVLSNEVSRVHLVMRVENGSLVLEDTSSNGTLVDGSLLHRDKFSRTDIKKITVGPLQLVVERKDTLASKPLEQAMSKEMDTSLALEAMVRFRKKVHRRVLDKLDLVNMERVLVRNPEAEERVRAALSVVLKDLRAEFPSEIDVEVFLKEMGHEILGLGPLEDLLADPEVSEVMVVDPYTIYVERKGKLTLSDCHFTDDDAARAVIERIVTPLGRRIDESTPIVDARLKDGSRVNVVIRPLALRGACITIRKFSRTPLGVPDMIRFGSMTQAMATFLERAVKARKNIVISGGTGSGKTTLLNVLSGAIPSEERVVTIEDAAELQLKQPHVVALETRPPNMEGKGAYTIRDLVKNALRMRPDRIVVGECRGGEALDMLQAMNTGHDGSMTTTHANSPKEAVSRLETLCLMSGLDLPSRAIREQIAASVHLIVQQTRFSDGSRRVTNISEVVGIESGELQLQELFGFYRTHMGDDGKVLGDFRASGYLPTFLGELIEQGLVRRGEYL